MRLKLIVAIFAGGVAISSSAFAHEPSNTAMLSNTCNGCHGTDGASAGFNPTVGGTPQTYIIDQMKKFKSGERPSTIMGRLAKAYSDDEIAAIASYYSTHKYVLAKQETDPAKVARGKEIHKERCEKCHEDNGRSGDDGGTIAGQWKDYLKITFQEFRDKKREMPKKMAAKVAGENPLSDADVDALIEFYASQK